MDVKKQPGSTNYAEAFDRALDKGIVLDAHTRMSPRGIDVRGADAVVVTAYSVITSNRRAARPVDSPDHR